MISVVAVTATGTRVCMACEVARVASAFCILSSATGPARSAPRPALRCSNPSANRCAI